MINTNHIQHLGNYLLLYRNGIEMIKNNNVPKVINPKIREMERENTYRNVIKYLFSLPSILLLG